MSGGVDSAVAAAQLMAEGYRVTGIYMDTWKDPAWESVSQAGSASLISAKNTADLLGIPFVPLDIRDRFFKQVVRGFIEQYLAGQTPNPCLFCNPQVKWGILQAYALEHGADYFATGHYARIERLESGQVRLLRGLDWDKDQSYVLCMLTQSQLQKSLLPLGGFTKTWVRSQARKMGLPSAEREDSQDLCFLGTIDYRDFLERYAPETFQPGEIVTLDGQVVGQHEGLALYTVGQRKGIRVAAAEPFYVVEKDVEHNRLVIGHAERVTRNALTANRASWIGGKPPEEGEMVLAKIRYRTKPAPAQILMISEQEFRLEFEEQLRGISPGQVAAVYSGEECLGGGVIQTAG
jgi:tRNA-specific 2-thiouridylase